MIRPFKGPIFSCPMFFDDDLNIDYKSLEAYLTKICSLKDVNALYSMSYNSRYMQLSEKEICDVNRFIYSICKAFSVSFICGHPITCTKDSLLTYADNLDLAGEAALSILYPERYFGIAEALIEYHLAPISLGYEVLVHEMKLISGFDGTLIDWDLSVLDSILKHDMVTGIKEDSKNDDISIPLIKKYANKKNIIIAGGGKRRAMALEKYGIQCWLNGSFMMFPELYEPFMSAWNSKNTNFLNKYIEIVEAPLFAEVLNRYGWHVGHKAVLAARGFCALNERSPMPVLQAKDFAIVKEKVFQIEKNILEICQ